MSGPRRVCVEMEGVLAPEPEAEGRAPGRPLPGALELVRTLVARGFEVDVVTTRGTAQARWWLGRHGFPVRARATNVRRPGIAYIGLTAVRWQGDAEAVLALCESAPPALPREEAAGRAAHA